MKKMRKSMIVAGLTLATLLVGLISCEKSDAPASLEIEGVYLGAFSVSGSLKSATTDGMVGDNGTAEVHMMGENQIEVHCFGEVMDTTFMLDYFEHNDSVMVCLTGDNFEGMYGHMLGDGHMGGGMMGDIQNGESEWMHHMNDEHNEGDEHFGGFDMLEHTFTYSFIMMDGTTPYYLKFHGTKN